MSPNINGKKIIKELITEKASHHKSSLQYLKNKVRWRARSGSNRGQLP